MMLATWLPTFVALIGAGMPADAVIDSVKLETRRWHHKSQSEAPEKPVDSKRIYLSHPLGMPGYAKGPKTLTIFGPVRAARGTPPTATFSKMASEKAKKTSSVSTTRSSCGRTGPFEARIGADYGKGGTLLVDDVPMDFTTTDMWWDNNWTLRKHNGARSQRWP